MGPTPSCEVLLLIALLPVPDDSRLARLALLALLALLFLLARLPTGILRLFLEAQWHQASRCRPKPPSSANFWRTNIYVCTSVCLSAPK